MENLKTFKIQFGYFHISPEKIYMVRQRFLKKSRKYIPYLDPLRIFLLILALLVPLYFYLSYFSYQWGEPGLAFFLAFMAIILIAKIYQRWQFTLIHDLNKKQIESIQFYKAIPFWRRVSIIINYRSNGIYPKLRSQPLFKRRVVLPGMGRTGARNLENAREIIQLEFPHLKL